tara:strand:+ start:277 stop:495 length:219 start_codon:yes stop_codon:yes gene_type:complete
MYSEILNQLKGIQRTLDSENGDIWMTLKDVCKYSKLSASTLYRNILSGKLKVSKKTGKNLFKKEWIDNFLGN